MGNKVIFIIIFLLNNIKCQQNFTIVDILYDSVLDARYTYEEKKLTTKIIFSGNGLIHDSVAYKYTSIGLLDTIYSKNSDSQWYKIKYLDLDLQANILAEKNIYFNFTNVFSSDINDISRILSVTDYYKVNFRVKDSLTFKIYTFDSLNFNIRFYPSLITRFIPENTILKAYKIEINQNRVIEEIYYLEEDKLIRHYFYKGDRIVKIESKSYYNDGRAIDHEIRTYVYH